MNNIDYYIYISEAIIAYTQAVNTLQLLRNDLAAINSEIQFSFRESIEPIYRELVGLLLQSNASQANIQLAREVIEDLRLAELDNFFREACLETKQQQIDEIDSQSAIIYPVILSNRLEVILSLPGKSFSQAGIAVKSGARTTLGTLWSVKDESTAQLMSQFYQQISQKVGKAKALRTAQLTLLKQSKYTHPYYWSPFVLIGNWL